MVWLCQKQINRLTRKAVAAIEKYDLVISPMVLLELTYLYEIKRVLQPAESLLRQLESQIGLNLCGYSFSAIIQTAVLETWTRDPFDRVIVAHAKANGYAALITPDARIGENYPRTIW